MRNFSIVCLLSVVLFGAAQCQFGDIGKLVEEIKKGHTNPKDIKEQIKKGLDQLNLDHNLEKNIKSVIDEIQKNGAKTNLTPEQKKKFQVQAGQKLLDSLKKSKTQKFDLYAILKKGKNYQERLDKMKGFAPKSFPTGGLPPQLQMLNDQFKGLQEPENRKLFVKGFAHASGFMVDSKECTEKLSKLGDCLPILQDMMLMSVPNSPNSPIFINKWKKTPSKDIMDVTKALKMLDNLVKLDQLSSSILIEGDFNQKCMNGNLNQLKIAAIKFFLFGEEISKPSLESMSILIGTSTMVFQLNQDAYEEAGESLAGLVEAISKMNVGVSDAELNKIDMVKCGSAYFMSLQYIGELADKGQTSAIQKTMKNTRNFCLGKK